MVDTPFETVQIYPDRFCATLGRAIEGAGGVLLCGSSVVGLLRDGHRAVGVRLANGEEVFLREPYPRPATCPFANCVPVGS